MLRELRIENIAIIEHCEIAFSEGLNILTGETGAGKSIILASLNLILGERASNDDIRTGADKAWVEAAFELRKDSAASRWLAEQDWLDANGELLVRREITRAGRNRCFINGRGATLAQLKELGDRLADLHGQHQHQSLLDAERHIEALDQFGDYHDLLSQAGANYAEWMRLNQALKRLLTDERETERLKDNLRYQIREIDEAAIDPGLDNDLESLRQRLQHAERLQLAAQAAYDLLYEGEANEVSIAALLGRIDDELGAIADIEPQARKLYERQQELASAIEDLGAELRDYRDGIDGDPQRLTEVDNRCELLRRLKRKYGATLEEVLEARDRYENELNALENCEAEIERTRKQLEKQSQTLRSICEELTKKRTQSAKKFSRALIAILAELNMPNCRFDFRMETQMAVAEECAIELQGERRRVHERGWDYGEFMLSTNTGEELKPLRKIASGGEISRIMLALKSMTAAREQIPTMVFDEIDVGISGATGGKVGQKMAALARHSQVICITHLPQIAACAQTHFQVAKSDDGQRATVAVRTLGKDARLNELARLISGETITQTGLKHARELIEKSG
ncbi:DNA repair protein RecN [Candidatus Sumerlaeota bacterium]|nr:DNA repair protein RecN [Candidatus Sumerlaeota bacterium]